MGAWCVRAIYLFFNFQEVLIMMKKVTMLVMAMALVVPVWDFSEQEIPTDYWDNIDAYCLEGPCAYFTTLFAGSFDAEAGELESSIWYSVQAPEVAGDYITVRLQIHLADGSEAECFWDGNTGAEEHTLEGNVVIAQRTVLRAGDGCEALSAGGYIAGGEGRFYTALVVDVIVHDGEEPPEDGPRVSGCFRDPTIVVDAGEVAETDETSAVLSIQLDRNPTADVTITIAEPLDPVDPNFTDLNSFTITGAVDGVATVVIPADSNSATITVTAIDDSVIEGDIGYGLVMESTMVPGAGYDPNLVTGDNALLVGGSVTVIDNDTRQVLVDPGFVEGLSENNDPNDWICVDVTLSHEPTAIVNVNVNFLERAVDEGMVKTDVDLEDPNVLQFDAGDWSTPKQICFAAIDNEYLVEVGLAQVFAVAELIPSSEDTAYDSEASPIWPGAAIEMEVEEKACGGRGFDFRDTKLAQLYRCPSRRLY
jgi:hypothetical protein